MEVEEYQLLKITQREKKAPPVVSVFSPTPLLFDIGLWSVSALSPPASKLQLLLFVCDRLLLGAIGLRRSVNEPTPPLPPMAWVPSPWALHAVHCLGQSGGVSPGRGALPVRRECVGVGVEGGRGRSWSRSVYSIWRLNLFRQKVWKNIDLKSTL